MGITWDRIAGWVTLIALGFALGIGFLALRQSDRPDPIDIVPSEPTATIQPLPSPTSSPIHVYVTGAVNAPAELEALPGIGPSLAANILAFREANGPFPTLESLMDVPGIGEAKLAAIRDLISIAP